MQWMQEIHTEKSRKTLWIRDTVVGYFCIAERTARERKKVVWLALVGVGTAWAVFV
jgi:hypothetical protein